MAKEVKTNAMRLLDRLHIPYEVNLYTCTAFVDAIQVADQLNQPYDSSFKTLVAQGKSGGYYVFVIPIAAEVDLKAAASTVGEKSVVLIPVKNLTPITGYVRGGVSPLGMKKVFPTVIDQRATAFNTIIISGGRLGAQIFLAPNDLARAVGARFASICA